MTDEEIGESKGTLVSARSGLLDFYSDRAVAQASFFVAIAIGLFSLLAFFVDSRLHWVVKEFFHMLFVILILLANYCLKRFRYYCHISNELERRLRDPAKVKEMWIEDTNLDGFVKRNFEENSKNVIKKTIQKFLNNTIYRYSLLTFLSIIPILIQVLMLCLLPVFG